jgi:hypothetical protein
MSRHNSKEYYSDWKTPYFILNLDPASDFEANKIINADNYYTVKDNGLNLSWDGNIYLNYPGGKGKNNISNSTLWINKAIYEIENNVNCLNIIICLFSVEHLNINPQLFKYPICFLRKRISFVKDGNTSSPSHNNALALLSKNEDIILPKFINEFREIGTSVKMNILY